MEGITNPVVQIIDESNGELVYALRIQGTTFRPKVFHEGKYTVKVGDPDKGLLKTVFEVSSVPSVESKELKVRFP